MMTIEQAQSLLPKVGDKRMESIAGKNSIELLPPQKCVVVEVNREKLWYRVLFETGFCECYKVPKGKTMRTGDVPW
jgi:hypothetical protein